MTNINKASLPAPSSTSRKLPGKSKSSLSVSSFLSGASSSSSGPAVPTSATSSSSTPPAQSSFRQVLTFLITGIVMILIYTIAFDERHVLPLINERLGSNNRNGGGSTVSTTTSSTSSSKETTAAEALPPGSLHRGSTDDGIEYYWNWKRKKKGTTAATTTRPKALFFAAHGCGHSAKDWHSDTNCPDCVGLPEEMSIVDIALSMDVAIVVASSVGQCWSEIDGPRIANVLDHAIHKSLNLADSNNNNNNNNIPIYAFGASSGGSFVSSRLPQAIAKYNKDAVNNNGSKLNLSGYICQIPGGGDIPPPTFGKDHLDGAVFITMNRDKMAESRVVAAIQNVPNKGDSQNRIKHIRLDPLPLTDQYFSNRIRSINKELSKSIVRALQKGGYVNKETRLLKYNPRKNKIGDWRDVVRPLISTDLDTLVADKSPISEVMNVAWGQHELARDGVADAIAFLLSQQKQQQRQP